MYQKLKSALISPIGTSPMVASEIMDYILKVDETIRDVYLLHTTSDFVKKGTYACMSAIETRYAHIHAHLEEIEESDIFDDQSLVTYVSKLCKIIEEGRRKFGVGKFYLNATGGRKVQSMLLTLISSLVDNTVLFNIVNKDTQNFNVAYERIRDIIETFSLVNRNEVYSRHRNELDSVFFPRMDNIFVINVPTIPIPRDFKAKIRNCITGIDFEGGYVADYEIEAIRQAGLITVDNHRTYSTPLGEALLGVI